MKSEIHSHFKLTHDEHAIKFQVFAEADSTVDKKCCPLC